MSQERHRSGSIAKPEVRTMSAVDIPEGYRMTELGPLPEEWRVVPFGRSIRGKAKVPKVKSSGYQPIGRIPVVDQGRDLIAGFVDKPEPFTDPLPVIVFGDHTRVFKFVDFPFVAGADGTQVLLPNTELFNPRFLFFAFLQLDIPNRGYNRHFPLLKEKVLPLPPLLEQRAIARVLRTVQRAKEATERVIQATRELKKSLMRHLFTYGPVPIDEAEKVPLKETEIGLAPEHWEVARLGEVAKTASGGTPSRKHPEYFDGKIPWVKSGELNDNLITYTEETLTDAGLSNSNAKIFPKGTLLIAMYGATAGKVGLLGCQAATNQAVCAIFPHKEILPRYLFYTFIHRRSELLSKRYGGAQPNISQTVIKAFNIPIPPLSEQREIAHILEVIDKKLQAEEAKKQALETLFKTLLHNLMTGKVRVKDLLTEDGES